MSNKTKTIKINPDLFSLKKDKSKSRKNTHHSLKPNIVINQNQVKKKLLDRIKQHRIKHSANENKESTKNNNLSKETTTIESNEFIDSLNYLQDKFNESSINKVKKNKTLRNPFKKITNPLTPIINMELPKELKEPFKPNKNLSQQFNHIKPNASLSYNSKGITAPPYGCLKSGTKPTYRNWNKTRKNIPLNDNIPSSTPIILNDNNLQKNASSLVPREEKLRMLREQFKENNSATINNVNNNLASDTNCMNNSMNNSINNNHLTKDEPQKEREEPFKEIKKHPKYLKKITKKTTTRKYTLGKSKTEKKISILIKDNKTRKQIIDAQKDIRNDPIHDIKKYLREHGLLKVGSAAPDNILRKMYETSILTGDVINKNKDLMLHNFLLDIDK